MKKAELEFGIGILPNIVREYLKTLPGEEEVEKTMDVLFKYYNAYLKIGMPRIVKYGKKAKGE